MKKRSKTRRNVEAVIWYIVMGILAILFVLPFIWMLSTAFKDRSSVCGLSADLYSAALQLEGF